MLAVILYCVAAALIVIFGGLMLLAYAMDRAGKLPEGRGDH
jgi:hypothetical protein